jgi:hypothetical protein
LVVPAGVGLADGSGLAAETTAAPPAMSSAAAMPAVKAARRKPVWRDAEVAGVDSDAAGCAGGAGRSFGSIWISLVWSPGLGTLVPMIGTLPETVLR